MNPNRAVKPLGAFEGYQDVGNAGNRASQPSATALCASWAGFQTLFCGILKGVA